MAFSVYKLFKTIQNGNGIVVLSEEQLQRLQQCLKGIMADILDVCRKENIQVMLYAGSALGAVRHHDIIPWDDDVDVCLFRCDYARFLTAFAKYHGDRYWLHTPEATHDYGSILTKIVLKNTKVRLLEDLAREEYGAYIDVFVIENAFDNAFLRGLQGLGSYALKGILSCRRICRDLDYILPVFRGETQALRTIKRLAAVGRLFGFLSLDRWTRIAVWWNQLCKKKDSAYVFLPAAPMKPLGTYYERALYGKGTPYPFGDQMWLVPSRVEEFLTSFYGDYMRIPALAEREKHCYKEFDL